MMSGHSRRKNSWLGIQESQERLSFKNDLPDMGYSPLKSYRAEQYGNSSENVTPRKNVRNYTDKQNQIQNYPSTSSNYRQFDQSPLKQSMNLYDMQARQPIRTRPMYQSKLSNNTKEQLKNSNYNQKYRQNNEQSKSRNYCYDLKDQVQKRPQSGAKKYSERQKFLYGDENDGKSQKGRQGNTEILKNINISQPENPHTPRKQERPYNNLIQKSEKVKQKIDRLNRMTPRRSYLRDQPEYDMNYYASKTKIQTTRTQQKHLRSHMIQRVRKEEPVYQAKIHFEKEEQPIVNDTQKDKNLESIAYLSKKISQRLKAIIQKHGN